MTSPRVVGLADIIQSAVGDRILGLRTGLGLTQTPEGPPPVPQFERRVWTQESRDGQLVPIPSDLLDELNAEGPVDAVFLDTFVLGERRHNRRPTIRTGGRVYRDSAAIIHHVVQGLPNETAVAILAPASLTTLRGFEQIRADIDEGHGVAWIIYADGRLLPGVHHMFQFVVMVLNVGTGPANVTRLVDLRGVESGQWLEVMRAAGKRGGGEVGASIVLRDTRLGKGAWTYERWTRALTDSMSDSSELGDLQPLSELVDSVVVGLNMMRDRDVLLAVGDEESAPPGCIPVIEGRGVRADGVSVSSRFWAHSQALPPRARLAEGDLLFRAFVSPGPSGPELVGVAVPAGLHAALGPNVIRLRWKDSVGDQARELLTSWLLSERASRPLAALGLSRLQLHVSALLELPVPRPKETIVTALDALAELEAWYRERAEAVSNARQAVFSAQRYRDAVPVLLHAQQSEGERVTAAEDSQKFDYRVRNYFPHPLALRRERLQVHEHGKERLEYTLECAEHLVHYLALCGLVHLQALRPNESIPSSHLRSIVSRQTMRFSWGSSWSVLTEAVDAIRASSDPLAGPIPQLSLLAGVVGDSNSALSKAEAELRRQRNKIGHLHRIPLAEVATRSQRLGQALDELLAATTFLADIPLVHVRDYALDAFTGERKVDLEILRGASIVFERSVQVVDRELPRGSLAVLGQGGVFCSLTPWLVLHTCEVCKRPEVFVFSRCEQGAATFVAMETGHSWESGKLGRSFSSLLLS